WWELPGVSHWCLRLNRRLRSAVRAAPRQRRRPRLAARLLCAPGATGDERRIDHRHFVAIADLRYALRYSAPAVQQLDCLGQLGDRRRNRRCPDRHRPHCNRGSYATLPALAAHPLVACVISPNPIRPIAPSDTPPATMAAESPS